MLHHIILYYVILYYTVVSGVEAHHVSLLLLFSSVCLVMFLVPFVLFRLHHVR